jgi:hypothetical protein
MYIITLFFLVKIRISLINVVLTNFILLLCITRNIISAVSKYLAHTYQTPELSSRFGGN